MVKPKITRRNVSRFLRGKKSKALPGGLSKKIRTKYKLKKAIKFSKKSKQKPKELRLPKLMKKLRNLSEKERDSGCRS